MESEGNDLYNTIQDQVLSFLVVYHSETPSSQNFQFQVHPHTGKIIWNFSKWCKMTQYWVLCSHAHKYLVVIATRYKDWQVWADCVDGFIWFVKQTNKMHIVPVRVIVGLLHLVRQNAASDGIDSVRLVHNPTDFDTYQTVYY